MKTNSLWRCLAAAAGVVWLAGCSTVDTRIRDNPEAFAQLNPQQQALVRAGQVGVGFNMDAVKLALGNPDSITLRADNNGQTQIWHYLQYAYYDGAFLYAGWDYPGFYGGRHWGAWGGGWWGPGPYWGAYPESVRVFDRFRITFKDGKVSSFEQELPSY